MNKDAHNYKVDLLVFELSDSQVSLMSGWVEDEVVGGVQVLTTDKQPHGLQTTTSSPHDEGDVSGFTYSQPNYNYWPQQFPSLYTGLCMSHRARNQSLLNADLTINYCIAV